MARGYSLTHSLTCDRSGDGCFDLVDGRFDVATGDDDGANIRTPADQVDESVPHLANRVWRVGLGNQRCGIPMGLLRRIVAAPREGGDRFGPTGDQRELDEDRAAVSGDAVQLVDELGSRQELGDDHVVPGDEMGSRHRRGQCPSGKSGVGRLVEPSAELTSNHVDVEVEGERSCCDESIRDGRFAGRGWTIEEHENRHVGDGMPALPLAIVTTDAVPILRVSEAATAVAWYRRLGFHQVFEHRFELRLPAYVGIKRDGAQIHLSEHDGDANPHGLIYLWVDDVDAVAGEFGVTVNEQPWGREISLTDPDFNRVRVAEPVLGPSADDVLGDGVTETLVDLERAMWSDATRGDLHWMADQLAETFTEFGSSGATFTRQDTLDHHVAPIDATLDQFVVRALGRDAALVTYRSHQPRGAGNRSSVWVRTSGRWCLDFHQGTPTT